MFTLITIDTCSKCPYNFIEIHAYHHVVVTLYCRFRNSKNDYNDYKNATITGRAFYGELKLTSIDQKSREKGFADEG
jgi:hypothetical protein